MKRFVKLQTSDSKTPFYVRPERITSMYRHGAFTIICFDAFTGSGAWNVKETPEEIARLIEIEEMGGKP